ncbi:MAG: sodium:solute symporter family protein [Syntrophorhabdaceae bacterium]|nr:sodium:solute symporter family protein [Syntrophorhabdaceae bacterium]
MIWIVLLLGVVLVFVSAYGYKLNKKTAADYLLAGRAIGTFVMFFYVYFAISSAWTFYGFPGTIYNTGPGFMLFFSFTSFAFLYIIIGPKLWAGSSKYGYLSPVQFLGERYQSKALRLILGGILVLFLFPYLGLQAVGIGAGMKAAVGLPFWFGALYMTVIMLLICLIGGTRSVAWLNVLLGIIFTATFWGFLFWILIKTDNTSLSELAKRVQEIRPGLLGVPGPVNAWTTQNLMGLALAGLTVMAWPHVVIGTMQVKSMVVVRKTAIWMLLFSLIFCNIAAIWGYLVCPILVPGLKGKAADAVVQIAITKYLPGWASGATLLAVLAAAISTVATQLMVTGLLVSRDIIFSVSNKVTDKGLILWSRIGMVGAAVVSFILAILRPAELGLLLSNIASPGFALWLPALIGGVLWKRGTKEGVIVGIVAGLILLIVGSFFYKPLLLGFHPIFVPLLVDALLYVGVSLITSPVPSSVQKKFFEDIEDYLEEHASRNKQFDINRAPAVSPQVVMEAVKVKVEK